MTIDPRLPATAGALGALLVAGAADWWTVGGTGISGTRGTGGLAAILPGVVLAAVLATLTLAVTGRRVVAVVAALAGFGMAALGWFGAPPTRALVEQLEPLTALTSDWSLAATPWPAVYGTVGLVVALASGWWVVRPPVRRTRVAPTVSGDVTDPVASWKAMDDGVDPTDEGGRA